MIIWQLFQVKRIMSRYQHVLYRRQKIIGQDYSVSTLYTLHLTVSEITKQSLKLTGQFCYA